MALGSLETRGFLTCSLCGEGTYQIRALDHTIHILHRQYHDRPALLQHEHCELAHGVFDGVGGHHAEAVVLLVHVEGGTLFCERSVSDVSSVDRTMIRHIPGSHSAPSGGAQPRILGFSPRRL